MVKIIDQDDTEKAFVDYGFYDEYSVRRMVSDGKRKC
jgi:hypothetical protein